MTGKSKTWAYKKLKSWLDEQECGGPKRVFVTGKNRAIKTTIGIVQREFLNGTRDPWVMRRFQDFEKELDRMARRIDALTTELHVLKAKRAS